MGRSVPITLGSDNPNRIRVSNGLASVAGGATPTLLTFTVPAGKTLFLESIDCSGENIAEYSVFIDGAKAMTRRTYFSEFNTTFWFLGESVAQNKIIDVILNNFRPSISDFDSMMIGLLL